MQSFSSYDAPDYGYISNYNTAMPQPHPPQPQPRPSSSRDSISKTSNRVDIPPDESLNLIQTDNTMTMSTQQQLPFYNQPQQINWESSPIRKFGLFFKSNSILKVINLISYYIYIAYTL
jgi:hypothetical protein